MTAPRRSGYGGSAEGVGRPQHRVFYGWVIIGVIWIVYLLCATPMAYGSGVIMTGMMEDGLSELTYSYATSAKYLGTAVFSICITFFIRRLGRKGTLIWGALCLGLAYTVNCFFLLPPALFILDFFVMGCATVAAGVVSGPSLINAWFERNRALPMAIFLSAGAVGGFIMPLCAGAVLTEFNWRACWLLFVGMAVLSILLIAVFLRDKPEDIGEVKDGRVWNALHPPSHAEYEAPRRDPSRQEQRMTEVMRQPLFLLMTALSFLSRVIYAGFITYIVLAVLSKGGSTVQAAFALSLSNGAGLFGRLAAGVSDRIPLPPFVISGLGYVPPMAGCLIVALGNEIETLYVGACLVGLGIGFAYAQFSILTARYFGKSHFTMVYGMFNVFCGMGSAGGPLILRPWISLDPTYSAAYLILFAVNGLCIGLSFLLNRVTRQHGRSGNGVG